MTAAPPVPADPPMGGRVDRNATLDALRLAAAFGVVWIHAFAADPATSLGNAGRFAVPFFTITAIWLMARRPTPAEPPRVAAAAWLAFVGRRFVRLYVPFLIWSVLYTLLWKAKLRLLHQSAPFHPDAGWLLVGGSMQLWFLPFLLIVQAIARAVLVVAAAGAQLRFALIVASAFGMVLSLLYRIDVQSHALRPFLLLAADALPAAFAGTAVALTGAHRRGVSQSTCVICIAIAAFACVALVLHGRDRGLETFAGFMPAIAATYPATSNTIRFVGRLGTIAFGIYLIHTGVLQVLRLLADRSHVGPGVAVDIGLAVSCAAISLLLCLALARLPFADRIARLLGLRTG